MIKNVFIIFIVLAFVLILSQKVFALDCLRGACGIHTTDGDYCKYTNITCACSGKIPSCVSDAPVTCDDGDCTGEVCKCNPTPTPSPAPPQSVPAAVDLRAGTSQCNPSACVVAPGSSLKLKWTTFNGPTSCNASGAWGGGKDTGGGEQVVTIGTNASYTFTLACSNSAGGNNDSVYINTSSVVPPSGPPPPPPGSAPTVDLTCNGQQSCSVTSGSTIQLNWTSTDATSCSASNSGGIANWTGSKTVGAGQSQSGVGPVDVITTFTLFCTGSLGTASDTLAVNMASFDPNPTPVASSVSVSEPNYCSIGPGGQLIQWTYTDF